MNIKLDTKTIGQFVSAIILLGAFCIIFPGLLSFGQSISRLIVIIAVFAAACFIIYLTLTIIAKMRKGKHNSSAQEDQQYDKSSQK
jgi:hypothetical protein